MGEGRGEGVRERVCIAMHCWSHSLYCTDRQGLEVVTRYEAREDGRMVIQSVEKRYDDDG